jgi:putative transposase
MTKALPQPRPSAIEVLGAQYREHPGWTATAWTTCARLGGQRRPCRRPIPRFGATSSPRACSARPGPSAPPRAPWHGPRPARTTGGPQLRGRSRQCTVAPGFPSRLAQGAHARATGSSRCCWASSTTARAWSATCSGISTRQRESLVHGLSQAFMKRGLPRALMTDNGAAMLADETVTGLAALASCIRRRCRIRRTRTPSRNPSGAVSRAA